MREKLEEVKAVAMVLGALVGGTVLVVFEMWRVGRRGEELK